MSDLVIETAGLTKIYGRQRAVDSIDLSVPRGGVHGFLGPNGAGKTTAIRMLSTLILPDEGSARVLGYDVVREADHVRSHVSLTGQFASVDEDLTGHENLRLLARLHGYRGTAAGERADQLLAAFGLDDAAGKQVKKFSGGMRRRIDIAASLVVTPELLFLDEPTTGLDPRARNEVWDIVRALVAHGTTVLLTTQYLDEADHLADRISVIDRGRIIAEGTSSELKASVGSGTLHVRVMHRADRARARDVLVRELGVPVEEAHDPQLLVAAIEDRGRVTRALTALEEERLELAQFALGQPTLDEVFLALTGHAADDADAEEAA
ncbi:ATP-binding cassette domain-containing protein [Demequina sp. SYSU T00039]|uniref:ATP-binding cassette domain-containing protein n=1 Tax=Demequina lignilytica TaxID=3051663 RepID=A0AAW7MAK1_9MICO|nr:MULTISPECIES: ATP-binding cassette domain-containing protein [unclassified Demequina]MDN4478864.1 ATP-binding cassette domain-containing protein [Demequina sp. SYSU T00039-1]MDN4488962.1 ATP-binding cassette domain-containing protein [Demequina sp. SYSU T00039]MDN4490380.1 ATP-binding cassette domain-containing protein [Demequina sp. SYSU T00068]